MGLIDSVPDTSYRWTAPHNKNTDAIVPNVKYFTAAEIAPYVRLIVAIMYKVKLNPSKQIKIKARLLA